jgi:hypothetical protein
LRKLCAVSKSRIGTADTRHGVRTGSDVDETNIQLAMAIEMLESFWEAGDSVARVLGDVEALVPKMEINEVCEAYVGLSKVVSPQFFS